MSYGPPDENPYAAPMAPPTPSASPTPALRQKSRGGIKAFGGLLAFLLAAGVIFFFVRMTASSGVSELALLGPMVHASSPEGGRVLMLTSQMRTYTPIRRGQAIRSTQYVDIWAFSDTDAKPIWRRRLLEGRDIALYEKELLGAQGDTVWLLFDLAPIALSLKTGDVIAPKGHLEALNPELRGMMPTDRRYFSMDKHGLHVYAADAREWHIDPETFKASPANEAMDAASEVSIPSYFVPTTTGMFMERGLEIPGGWLGLLTDAEAKSLDETHSIGGLSPDIRRRLWRALATREGRFSGDMYAYSGFAPLPEGPDYLEGGLLREYRRGENLPALWLRDPDSVLVLHRERLGHEGGLRLTRVAASEGSVVWEARLPLTILQSVVPLATTLVLFGREYRGPKEDKSSDSYRDAQERLVVVSLATGAVHVHDHANTAAHPEAVPVAPF